MDIGVQLRSAREAKGLSIASVARATRIPARILEAIERNDSHVLPPRPYGRGSVRAYASEVGLDPDRTVREFFAQFAPAGDATPIPARHTPAPPIESADSRLTLGTLVLCVLMGALLIGLGRSLMTDDADPRPVGTTGATSPLSAGTAGVVAAPAPPPADAPAASAPVMVTLEASAPVWITATVDGRRVVYRTIQPGERVQLQASDRIRLRIGDAGAVRWQINGRPAAVVGASGEVRTILVTPANAASVK